MLATMLVAAIIASVYILLVAGHVAAIRREGAAGVAYRPWVARWIAASGERRRARLEGEAVHQLMTGGLNARAYRVTMAALAAQDEMEHPLDVPRTRL
ncbi:hypothetical protein [Dactylosporangium darangshiense]|uniref:Uncharacterized protein n=1 Tax=Dactylosporangium darangshiense TaxID=579108 RepID=A0ABP8DV18_9ACTN